MNFLIDVFYYVIYRTIWLSARKSWGVLNSAVNFFLYSLVSQRFRRELKKVLTCAKEKEVRCVLRILQAKLALYRQSQQGRVYQPGNYCYPSITRQIFPTIGTCSGCVQIFTIANVSLFQLLRGTVWTMASRERFREAAPGISRGLVVTVPDWSFCNWKTLWSSLWREGNFFLVPGFLSRYELSCWKWRIRHPCIPSLLAIEAVRGSNLGSLDACESREVGLSRFRHRDRVSISPCMPFPISMLEHRIQGWAMPSG